ncbi:uncharacterized protein CCR75_008067 [Bremia lactucae]|uniref:Uncharacterized protein n=1 Tax=Bremia lactucae TaxID=4779 RepID=A0A976IAU8_BRELC|nr:hypothetical protein CCR75_008067 [Bremia lactucae]
MDTILLKTARAHVGERVHFIAAVQQIAMGKRTLVARQRIQPCHVLLVGDATRQFFKVTCWGEAQPTLVHRSTSEDISDRVQVKSADAELQVGDIIKFSLCCIKLYRGNVEAQFFLRDEESAISSTAQLLYRKDRYFSTQGTSIKDLYPMIEWYKHNCRETGMIEGKTPKKINNRVMIKDLHENTVASVVCKLQLLNEKARAYIGKEEAKANELHGVLLCKLVMFDSVQDSMTVNLWDQHADKRFVARLLKHCGAIEIIGIVVSLQALSNRLLANTTPQTLFRFLALDDLKSIKLEKRLSGLEKPLSNFTNIKQTTFATIEKLKSCPSIGHALVQNVRVERMYFNRYLGSESSVLPQFTSHLAEKYCMECEQTLEEFFLQDIVAQRHFGACKSTCQIRKGSSTINAPWKWRYRRLSIILRDLQNEQLQVEVDDQAIVEMVGNITADVLVASVNSKRQKQQLPSTHFDAESAVASLLNAFVTDASQTFEAQLSCVTMEMCDVTIRPLDSIHDTSLDDSLSDRRRFCLVSITPCDGFSI